MPAFTEQQLAQITEAVRTAVREELADAGLRVDGADHQDEARRDFTFVRKLRLTFEGGQSKVGAAVLFALTSGLVWLFWQGAQVLFHITSGK